MESKIKRIIAILLLVCFLISLTATSVNAVSFDSKKTAGKTTTIVEMFKGTDSFTYTPSGKAGQWELSTGAPEEPGRISANMFFYID